MMHGLSRLNQWSVCWRATQLITLIFLLSLASGLNGCASISRGVSNINLISTAEEVEMGAQFATEIESELEILDDPEVTAYVDAITQNLVQHCRRQDIQYHVKVVNSEEINAFAVLGGFLYFNVGLLRAAETEAELAGVVGHEIGHVVERHSAKHLSKQLGISMVAQILLGQDPEAWKALVANVLATGAMMHYSREAEREADADAVEEMVGAGHHPSGVVLFFEKIRDLQQRSPGAVERFFATHPPTEERLEATRTAITGVGDLSHLRMDSPEFHQMKTRLPEPPRQQSEEEDQG